MIYQSTSNISNYHPHKQSHQNLYKLHHSHQCRDDTDFNNELPVLDFDFLEKHLPLEEDPEALQSFQDYLTRPMQSDSWGGLAQPTPKIRRFSHQRESSLSSLGSTGPASPYAQNTSNPHIAISDPALEGLSEMTSQDFTNNQPSPYYQLAKPMGQGSYQTYHHMDGTISEMAYPVALSGLGKGPRMDKGLLPAAELAAAYSESYPASAASSGAGDSPVTPAVGDSDRKIRRNNDFGQMPKLDRTMTDVYGDELYNPNFTITAASSPQPHSVASTGSDVFSQRINAANHQHLSATHSPASTTSRARSPFRTGSPFATPSSRHFKYSQSSKEKEQQSGRLHSHVENAGEPETPKTISPKDAVLEFNESDADGVFPLFPQDPSGFQVDDLPKTVPTSQHTGLYMGSDMGSVHSTDQFECLPSQLPTGIQVPQQYPFIARPKTSHDTPPPRLSSSGASSVVSGGNTPAPRPRPTSRGAEGGTYTCTYHGCTMRFETPTLLQKHKREGHRQPQALSVTQVQDLGMMSNMANTQAGPHRCERINPSTGKPCNTVFSRPYDLTRHEDTIHNARKQKVRCTLCTEEKTFSRADALTRHYRVCHPDMELPVKGNRRSQ